MAKRLLGKEVNEKLNARIIADCEALKARGVNPTMAIVRCGERPDDLSYERGATKRAETLGVAVEKILLPEDVSKEELLKVIDDINANDKIHGVLLFRPLPKHLKADQDEICNRLDPPQGRGRHDRPLQRRRVHGQDPGLRSLHSRRLHGDPQPLRHRLHRQEGRGHRPQPGGGQAPGHHAHGQERHCHHLPHRTKDVPPVTREADILVSAAGVLGSLTKEYVRPGQIVVDVSINWDEAKGGIAGDAVYEEVEPIVEAITPVPGGVGAVTTSVLIGHVVEAAKRTLG